MVKLIHTTCISVDLLHYVIFCVKVGKCGIIKVSIGRVVAEIAFGKFLVWSYISVTDLQTLSCLVSF